MKPEQIARWACGTWTVPPTFPITAVTQDSRAVRVGALYVALRGVNHDGHDFVTAAFRAGATAALVRTDWVAPAEVAGLPLLRVGDPATALVALAKGYREALRGRVMGITGSAGKTTLKELAAAMLSGAGTTASTPGNHNNAVGLPLSLLAVPEEARFAVIEAGISHPGDMDPLADALRPDAAAISCIGPAHIANFGTVAAIAAEKAKLLAAVRPKGFAVLPKGVACEGMLREACRCRVVTAALGDAAADYVGEPLAKGVVRVRHANEPAVLLETGLCGEHNASNALIAYALAREAGATPAQILAGLEKEYGRIENLRVAYNNVVGYLGDGTLSVTEVDLTVQSETDVNGDGTVNEGDTVQKKGYFSFDLSDVPGIDYMFTTSRVTDENGAWKGDSVNMVVFNTRLQEEALRYEQVTFLDYIVKECARRQELES